jgi:Ion channel
MAAPAPSKGSANSRQHRPGVDIGTVMTKAWPARRAAGRGDSGRTGQPESGGRYGLLLLILIASYLISAFSNSHLVANIEIVLFVVVLLIALRTSSLPGRWPDLIGAIVVLGSLAALGASLSRTRAGDGAAEIWAGLLLLVTAALIVRRVLAKPTVTIQSIYGALSAYLIVGLMFAAFYAALDHLTSAPFFADSQPATTQTFQYFSFTTLTTLGYGDFTAAGNGGRAIAIIEALAGQVFLATLVARLVAAFRGPVRPPGQETSRRPRRLVVRDGAGLTHHRKSGAGPRKPSSRAPGPASRGLPYCVGGESLPGRESLLGRGIGQWQSKGTHPSCRPLHALRAIPASRGRPAGPNRPLGGGRRGAPRWRDSYAPSGTATRRPSIGRFSSSAARTGGSLRWRWRWAPSPCSWRA